MGSPTSVDDGTGISSLSIADTAGRGGGLAPGGGREGPRGAASPVGGAAAEAARSLPALAASKARHAKDTFGDLLAVMSPTQLVAGDDPVAEAEHWSLFADVYEREVRHQEAAAGGELGLEQRRQVLADILVWAEVTQSRYDEDTASFVTEPHEQDASFRRIGDMLKAAKASRGLCR